MLADWFNMVQRELLQILTDAGISPDINDDGQLSQALGALAPAQNIAVFDTTGTTNWTVPNVLRNGHRKAFVTVIGGGGSGGKGSVTLSMGGGGGAGGLSMGLVDLSGVDDLDITVGAGGASPGTTSGLNGNPGASSSFGSILSATGGNGGGGTTGMGGGNAGVGAGGDINISLGDGHNGSQNPNSPNDAFLTTGGNGGGIGGGRSSRISPRAGGAPGAGGGAAGGEEPGVQPGAGADGIVIVRW
ncbi:glycine-rich domain-containing protein [Halomonas sp.]|uniref:glycine-rich domain-containing protein n=1 Tax=Halomonas sp. TaxID=1486246 RepID=UPI0033903C08